MQKGKGSTASPPAGAGRGQPPSQRGPTPPNRGQDDYSARNSQGYQPQGGMPVMFPQGMMQQNPQQGQPQRMPYYRGMSRPIRMPHNTSNPQMYPSPSPPVGVQQVIQMSGGGGPTPYGMSPQQYAAVDYQTIPGQQMSYRGPGQQVSGQFNQVPYPNYSTSASMPPPMYAQPLMFAVRNPIPQNMPGPQYPPARLEQQQAPTPRRKNIIQIKDPEQDNKDVTAEILSQSASSATNSGSPSLASESRMSGHSSTPPQDNMSKNNESLGSVSAAPAAVIISDPNDSVKKPKPTIAQVATPSQTAKSTSPKIMHPDVKIISINKSTRNVDKDLKKEESKSDAGKPQVKAVGEDVVQPKKPSDTSSTTVVDGAKASTEKIVLNTETKDKDSTEVQMENQINDNAVKPSISNETVPPLAPVDSKAATQVKKEILADTEPSKKPESKTKEQLSLESQEQTKPQNENLPNGSISPLTVSEEIVQEKTQNLEMVPSVKDNSKSDIKVTKEEDISKITTEAGKQDAVLSSVEPTQEEETVNGVESESKAKQTAAQTSTTSELAMKEHKRKKLNKRLKQMDKKPDHADLMDAYTEAPPPKEETKEEPKDNKQETKKEEQEEKAGSEEETWEDKDEKSEDGLWSPETEVEENKNGPRFYDRDFLLQFQFNPVCTEKPEGLPDIEVVLQTPVTHRPQMKQPYAPNRMGGGGGVDFMMPSYMRGQQRGQGQSGQSVPRSNKGRMPSKKVIHTIEQKVELNRSENRWVRPGEVSKKLTEDEKKHQDIIRKFRGILNKLTPQKFSTLIQQVLDLEIDTPERLEEVINIIFEKAISEPSFSVAYANMCRCLVPTNVKVESKDGKDTTITFRKILLNKCQKEFEKEKSDEINIHVKMDELLKQGLSDEELKVKKDELALEEQKGRRRTLGNIRFIGELFKLKMLTESIMHDCIIKLLKSNDEESYECLCKLLSTIGKDLDHPKAKPRMDQYFEQINKIIESKKTSSRCRFMLQDVKDLRASSWVPRRDDNNPKTIDQIHKEAAEEERKVMLLIQQTKMPKREPPGKGRDSPRPGGGVPQTDETWTTVPGRQRNVNVDPKKFQDVKKRTNVDTENISLGPGGLGGRGFGAWSRGSSGGSGPASGPSTPTEEQPRGNRFSALGGEGRRGPGASRQGSGAGRQESRTQGSTGRRPPNEREKALEAVRSVVHTKPKPDERQTPSPQPDDVEVIEPEARPPAEPSPPANKELTEEEIENKVLGLVEEFHNIQDLKEAIQCAKDLKTPEMHQKLVFVAFNHSMEKHSSERLLTAKLMHALLREKVVSEESFITGLDEILEFAEDMEIDIPHIWQYLGEMTGTTITDNVLSLVSLNKSVEKLVKPKAAKLMAEILISARNRTEPAVIDQLWSQSGLSFSNFFPSKEEELQFLKNNNLESLAGGCTSTTTQPHASKVQEELRNLILVKKSTNEDVFKWIDDNVKDPKDPKFIRTLVAVVCECCKKDGEYSCDTPVFRQRSPLLQKYVDGNRSLELQALFSLQALSVSLEHPPGFLKSFFNALYDEEVITEDAFFDWEKDESPSESQGKGTAKTSTVHFFEWLRSAEEEKPDES